MALKEPVRIKGGLSKNRIPALLAAFIAAAAFLLGAGAGVCQEAEVYITTAKAPGKISVVVPDFGREGNFVDRENRHVVMADVLSTDLGFSGYFSTDRVGEIKGSPSAWSSLGVEYVVLGSYTTDGREIHLKCKVISVGDGAVLMNRSYPNALRVMRTKVHEMSDDVISLLTGEKGVCRTKLAFASDMTGNNELYISDYDGHNVFRMTRDESTCLLPAWSPSGNYITYTSYRRVNPDLWWVTSTGQSRGILSFYSGLNTAATWAPDGERIALSLTKDGNAEIYVIKRDGTGLKRLTFSNAIDTSPTFSPSGREIAFNSDRSGTPQIYVMDSEGGNVRRLSYIGKYNASPVWSPTGDRIAYVSREAGLFNIYVMDVTGENVVRLTYNQGHNENPSWAPDGRHIVFSSTRDGKKALYIMQSDGGGVRKLNIPGEVQTPAWSPFIGG